jgi:photosystem II stability/assembly factor-like uncharacterized protein
MRTAAHKNRLAIVVSTILAATAVCDVPPAHAQIQDRLSAAQASESWKSPQQRSQQFLSMHQTGTLGASAATLRLQALQQNQTLPVFGGSWFELGPTPFFGLNPETGMPDETMSGQVSAIAVDLAHDPSGNLVYVGSSSGGLWKSTNGLSATPRFVPLSDQSQSLSVGAVALNTRSNPPTIYVGTGAPDNSANISSYTGVGILISTDGGGTWRGVDNADNGAHTFVGQGFSSILIDPVDTNTLLASTGLGIDYNFPHVSIPQGDAAFKDLGIYRSSDAGNTWTQVISADYGPPPPQGFYHTDLLYEPTQGTYFAGISRRGLFASTDRGETWMSFEKLGWGQGLPDASQMIRISLATRISLTTGKGVLWALLMLPNPDPMLPPPIFKLFQSDDQGHSWSPLSLPGELSSKGFLMYVAAPPNSHTLLVAAEHLFRRDVIEDPNSSWVKIEHNIHGDQHAIAFASATKWYVGDDGGAWATTNRGDNWTSLNEDLRTLEFFSADGDSAGLGTYVGGMQDNGPAFTTASPVGAHHVFPAWDQVPFGGDGMYVAADPLNSAAFFMSNQFGGIFYFSVSNPDTKRDVIDVNALGRTDFLTPYEILPNDPRLYIGATGFPGFNFGRSRILLTGANNPWLVAFDPDALSNNTAKCQLTTLVDNVINYVAPVPCHPTTAYVTAGSAVYRLNNISFAKNAAITQIAGGPINGKDVLGHLAVSRTLRETLYVTKVGFLEGHKVFKTNDRGDNWKNISDNLPNTPVNWVTIDPVNSDIIYVATDTGVYVANTRSAEDERWQRLGSGLPNVPVVQTKVLPGRKLIAATYGRNVWVLDISEHGEDDLDRRQRDDDDDFRCPQAER